MGSLVVPVGEGSPLTSFLKKRHCVGKSIKVRAGRVPVLPFDNSSEKLVFQDSIFPFAKNLILIYSLDLKWGSGCNSINSRGCSEKSVLNCQMANSYLMEIWRLSFLETHCVAITRVWTFSLISNQLTTKAIDSGCDLKFFL